MIWFFRRQLIVQRLHSTVGPSKDQFIWQILIRLQKNCHINHRLVCCIVVLCEVKRKRDSFRFLFFLEQQDIRELITQEDAMEEMSLGPNGALVFCLEYGPLLVQVSRRLNVWQVFARKQRLVDWGIGWLFRRLSYRWLSWSNWIVLAYECDETCTRRSGQCRLFECVTTWNNDHIPFIFNDYNIL